MSGSGNDWSDDEYAAAVKGAEEVFKATARVRAVLPWAESSGDRYVVSGPRLSQPHGKPWQADVTALTCQPHDVFSEFQLALRQLGDPDLLERLARRAAQDVAAVEGRAIFAEIFNEKTVQTVRYGAWEDIRAYLNRAVEKLQKANHVGPNVLIVTPRLHSRFRQLVSTNNGRVFLGEALGGELRDASVTPGDVPPNEGSTGCVKLQVADGTGLLISLGVDTVELVETSTLSLGVVEQSRAGWTFRLEERLAIRVVDTTGIVKLENTGRGFGTARVFTPNKTADIMADGTFRIDLDGKSSLVGKIESGSGDSADFRLDKQQLSARLRGGLEGHVTIDGPPFEAIDGTIELVWPDGSSTSEGK